jgi:hypothetical protein
LRESRRNDQDAEQEHWYRRNQSGNHGPSTHPGPLVPETRLIPDGVEGH